MHVHIVHCSYPWVSSAKPNSQGNLFGSGRAPLGETISRDLFDEHSVSFIRNSLHCLHIHCRSCWWLSVRPASSSVESSSFVLPEPEIKTHTHTYVRRSGLTSTKASHHLTSKNSECRTLGGHTDIMSLDFPREARSGQLYPTLGGFPGPIFG